MAKLKLGNKTFATRQQAVSFLQANPEYVKARIGNLKKGSPKLLKDAGYRTYTAGPDGGGWLLKDDKPIMDFKKMPAPIKPIKPVGQGNKTPTGSGTPSRSVKKSGNKKPPQSPPTMPGPSLADVAGMAGGDVGSGINYDVLAAQMGIDPALLRGLGPNVGNLIPLSMAQRGAKPMGPEGIDALVQSLVGDQYSRQGEVMERERARTEAQNKHNLGQLEHWYGQVIGSQGVAAERDREFGRAAVSSAEDTTRGIISALGGEANEGSYVVGAAGQENIGNINALGTIQDQFNTDMAPLLKGEMAGQLAREQAMGGDRLRDLSKRLSELQSERGTKEAELRYNVWQANNEILDRRTQNELAIRQANAALKQQRFANKMGVRQFGLAASTAGMEGIADLAGTAADEYKTQVASKDKAIDRQFRAQLEAAKEAGRNYRATLPSGSAGSKIKPYASATPGTKDSAWNDIVDALDGRELSSQQAIQVATAIAGGYGWSMKNAAVQSLVRDALREAGFDV